MAVYSYYPIDMVLLAHLIGIIYLIIILGTLVMLFS
ncbi:uncharacterized protein YGR016C-A [Saccharomyces cerevisiae S288C]|uniref:Uncharacterized protein YGR016C-A n=1 Tax=Saccharomyces cerevisiae (strain ATCC 204508 / S288c) TaxID=559292 RepID=YG106_YEAST